MNPIIFNVFCYIAVLKNAAEAPEKEAKDVHKANWDAQLVVKKEQESLENANKAFVELDTDQDSL